MGLDTVELVLLLEDEFAITLPDELLSDIRTVGQLCQLIELRLQQQGRELEMAQIYSRMVFVLVKNFRVDPQRISASAEFVRDLGLE
jgi:acyl carrier protein